MVDPRQPNVAVPVKTAPDRAQRRAEFLVRMLQGTMALEAQGLPAATLERLRIQAAERLRSK